MRMKWEGLRHAGKPTEQAEVKKPEKAKGGQSNIKRQPVRTLTDAEKAEWLRGYGL